MAEPKIISRTETPQGEFIKIVTVYHNDGKTRFTASGGAGGRNGQAGAPGGSVMTSGDRAIVTTWRHKDG